MIENASIEQISNGFLVEVRWPYAGTPLTPGKVFVPTLEEALPFLRKHFCVEQQTAGGGANAGVAADWLLGCSKCGHNITVADASSRPTVLCDACDHIMERRGFVKHVSPKEA